MPNAGGTVWLDLRSLTLATCRDGGAGKKGPAVRPRGGWSGMAPGLLKVRGFSLILALRSNARN